MTVAPAVSPARACALEVVRRVLEHGAYADRALHSHAAGLDPRERALTMVLAYGTIQRLRTIDHVAAELCSRPLSKLDRPVLAALRLGLFQLLFLDRVPDHAAVNDSVELAKPAGATLVNAVLRRAASEGRELVAELDDADPRGAAILHSLPDWVAEQWWNELGCEEARRLMRAVNVPAEAALRVNTLITNPTDVRARLGVPARPAPDLPEGLVLEGPFDAHGSELFEAGAIMPQSRGSMSVARMLAPRPGERVLDLCAAPGAKTTHLAALMGDAGEVVAVERHAGRARALSQTCERMRVSCARIKVADAASFGSPGGFDRVLVDPPCSGLGTLQSRPDLRWRVTPESARELAALQDQIVAAGAAALRPGGTLVYSVCTVSRREAQDVVKDLLASDPALTLEQQLQLLPHRDRTDGFYLARLRRRKRVVPTR